MDNDFLKWVHDNDGRTFKQGSRQEDFSPAVKTADIVNITKAFKDLVYDVKKLKEQVEWLTEHIERLEAENNGWHTDEWGNYKL